MSVDKIMEEYREANPNTKMLVILIPIADNAIPDAEDDKEAIDQFVESVMFVAAASTKAATVELIAERSGGALYGE